MIQTFYDRWRADHFSASEIGAGLADPRYSFSGDGVSNLVKYAFGLDPRVNADPSAPPAVAWRGADGALGIGFVRDANRSDINSLVEASTDLQAWTTIAESDTGAAVGNLGAASVAETAITGTGQHQVTSRPCRRRASRRSCACASRVLNPTTGGVGGRTVRSVLPVSNVDPM